MDSLKESKSKIFIGKKYIELFLNKNMNKNI
jgi:hypothetical protein